MYRDLVCLGSVLDVSLLVLVGGNYNNTTSAGLWCWSCTNTSSNSNSNIGSRLLIFRNIKSLHTIFLAPWQKLVVLGLV